MGAGHDAAALHRYAPPGCHAVSARASILKENKRKGGMFSRVVLSGGRSFVCGAAVPQQTRVETVN